MTPFDPDAFVADCVAALDERDPAAAVRDVVERTVAQPRALQDHVRLPLDPADDGVLHRSTDLFVAFAVFPPAFATGIHDHRMTAVIGTWAGYEDNLLYRLTSYGIEPLAPRRVCEGEVLVLDADAAHDVRTDAAWSGALHVYLGDLVGTERSFWPHEDAPATRFDGAKQEESWVAAARATGLLPA